MGGRQQVQGYVDSLLLATLPPFVLRVGFMAPPCRLVLPFSSISLLTDWCGSGVSRKYSRKTWEATICLPDGKDPPLATLDSPDLDPVALLLVTPSAVLVCGACAVVGTKKTVGYFEDEEDAARAVDR
jgi:hypothetical protein